MTNLLAPEEVARVVPRREIRARVLPLRVQRYVVENLALALDELDAETLGHVPGDVTVHNPDAGVVGRERNEEVAVSREHRNVAARWVVPGEGRGRRIERAIALRNDVEVVAAEPK